MAEDKKNEIEIEVIDVTEEYLKERLYEIRGKRVLLDADFMFELTDDELEDLRCKNCTANLSSKSRYNPHVFTEQSFQYHVFLSEHHI